MVGDVVVKGMAKEIVVEIMRVPYLVLSRDCRRW